MVRDSKLVINYGTHTSKQHTFPKLLYVISNFDLLGHIHECTTNFQFTNSCLTRLLWACTFHMKYLIIQIIFFAVTSKPNMQIWLSVCSVLISPILSKCLLNYAVITCVDIWSLVLLAQLTKPSVFFFQSALMSKDFMKNKKKISIFV